MPSALFQLARSCFILMLVFCADFVACSKRKPHIVFILADDLGWNDISFHGSAQIPTPNIDALAASGTILKNYYASPGCTPSRASLMTGRYSPKTGFYYILKGGQAVGLPLNFTIMPQHFKSLGYKTHLVGKWHLGYHKKEYTPTFRGFDSSFGYWNGYIDYFDHTYKSNNSQCIWGVDLHDGCSPAKNFQGKYAVDLFSDKAEEVIRNHDTSKPMFLYLAQIAPHIGSAFQPLQAPPEAVEKFPYIKKITRRTYAGVVSKLDESVGRVFAALHGKRMLDNSIIIFASDNGADVEGQEGNYGSNWPLRGSKKSMWEGGSRVPALIWSPRLRLKEPRVWAQRMHVSDWLPTLFSAAGGIVANLGNIDGLNMWRHIVKNLSSPRNEVLVNIDPLIGMSGLIKNEYKLVNGTYTPDRWDFWYGPSGRDLSVGSLDDWVWKNGSVVKDILERTGKWLIKTPNQWRKNTIVDCGAPSPPPGNGGCDPVIAPCLYNIIADPCEYNNLASQRPLVVEEMMRRIKNFKSESIEIGNPPIDLRADPRCYGFTFSPWRDPEYLTKPCVLC